MSKKVTINATGGFLKMVPNKPIERFAKASEDKKEKIVDIEVLKAESKKKKESKCSLCGNKLEDGFINADNLCADCLEEKYKDVKNGHHPV